MFEHLTSCWCKHHGLCETRDADRFAGLQELGGPPSGALLQMGLWYKVYAECGDEADQGEDHDIGAFFVVAALCRAPRPNITVFALALTQIDATAHQVLTLQADARERLLFLSQPC